MLGLYKRQSRAEASGGTGGRTEQEDEQRRGNPAKSRGKNTGNRNTTGELTKKDPEQRRILSTEDERRRRNQGGFWDEKPEKIPSNKKKTHTEPRKNPEPEAATRR